MRDDGAFRVDEESSLVEEDSYRVEEDGLSDTVGILVTPGLADELCATLEELENLVLSSLGISVP